MRWVRTNVRYGSWCALLAVAIHIFVSFGHAHRIDTLRQGEFSPPAATGTHGQSVVETDGPATKPIGLVFEYCAICAVINMGASMVPAEAPASVAPANIGQLRFSPRADTPTRAQAHLLFQARAPPFA
jgi:Protein of unknown function (DUF2946)